jgi:hypothetical protein
MGGTNMRKLYALSKPIDGKPQRLIGELSEENGEYTFKYRLCGKFPEWFLRLDEFPQANKIYKGNEVQPFVERKTPKRTSRFINQFMAQLGLTEYDEWAFLTYCGNAVVGSDETYLLTDLPKEVIIYE